MNRDTMRLNQKLPDVTPVEEGLILALWQKGYDTVSIAAHLRKAEFQIYNRLFHILQNLKEVRS